MWIQKYVMMEEGTLESERNKERKIERTGNKNEKEDKEGER